MTSLPPANLGLGTWPARRARITPDAVALVQDGRTLTYAALDERVRRLAAVLAAAGVRRGDRVAYLGPNDTSAFETFFAAGLLGAVDVALNTRLSPVEIAYMLADSTPTVLVHAAALGDLVPDDALPAATALRLVVGPGPVATQAFSRTAVSGYEEAVTAAEPLGTVPAVALDDPCLVLYTSGTTGRPKGAVLTHANLTWNTVNQLAHVDVLSTERALCIAPLFHVVGLGQVTLPTFFKGGSVEVLAKFDPGVVLEAISERGVTSFACVPTMLQMMCEHPAWEAADLSSLRTVIYGGSPVQERVARAWHARGVQVVQGFGMTEAAPGVCMQIRDGAGEKPVSIGPPHFFVDVAGFAAGEPAPLGDAPAELLVRGPNVFAGYLGRPDETADAFPADGWFRTGDVVRQDEDGWFYAVDRAKDMIISGGENIYPAEVEAVAVQLDEVAAAAVVAIPDERWGEVGRMFVEPRPGVVVDLDRVRQHLVVNLAKYKVPKEVVVVEALPRNATGKILRARLREG